MRAPDGERILSAAQVAQYAYQAGFRAEALVTAVAVAYAETGGTLDAHAVGDVDLGGIIGQQSTGLWQVNYQPKRDSATGTRSPTANLDPATNARNAYTISGGGSNWRPWSTYNSGAYKQYLPQARVAAASAASGVTPTAAPATGDSGAPILAVSGADNGPVLPITIGGRYLGGELGEAMVGGSVDFTVNGVSEIVVTFSDPDYRLCNRFKMQPDGELHFRDLPFRIIEWRTDQGPGAPHVSLVAQPEGVVKMREASPGARSNISPTDYMQQIVTAVGLKFVGEASGVLPSIGPAQVSDTRMHGLFTDSGTSTATRPETAWEIGQRLGNVLGFYAYEAAGTFYFASAHYLHGIGQQVQISHDDSSFGSASGPLFSGLGIPSVAVTKIDLDPTAQRLAAFAGYLRTDVNFLKVLVRGKVSRDHGENLQTGMRARFTGVGPFLTGVGQLITRVSWDLTNLTAPVSYEAGTLDPKVGTGRSAADDAASLYGTGGTAGSTVTIVKGSILDFVTTCIRQAGKKYVWGAEDPNVGFDCSGLVQWAASQHGVILPRTAGPQFDAVKKAGLTMSIEQAYRTRGAVLYRATNAIPGVGEHIVVSLGDGKHTIEARGSAYGVVEGPITGRTWTGAGKLPGFTY